MTIAFIWIFIILLVLGMPIAFILLVAPLMSLLWDGQADFLISIISRMYNGINSFPLMAIPFFVLAGELMNVGGVSQSIINLSRALVGHLRGGIIQINILSSMLFAGLTGSAVAEASAIGKVMIPIMEKSGIKRNFAAAITIASSIIGPIIPPSGIMIIYAYVMNVSVAALFAGGIVPGIMMGLGLMTYSYFIAKRRNYPITSKRASVCEIKVAAIDSFFPLMMPVIILVGVISGVFTITESSVIAVVYVLVITAFRSPQTLKRIPAVLQSTVKQSCVILFLVGAAVSFGWLVTVSGFANHLSENILGLSDNIYVILFLLNILLITVGMFLDAGPAILILGPAIGPIFIAHGVDPVQFAMVMCLNLTVGLATPPVGLVLFSVSSLTKLKIEEIVTELLPLLFILFTVVFLITFYPGFTLIVPEYLGLL